MLFCLTILLSSNFLFSQNELPSDSTENTTIIIEHADNTVVEKVDDVYFKYLNGNVRVIHDSTFFYCDSAIIRNDDLTAIGNVVILQSDSTTLFSDSLNYNADSLKAILNGRVLLLHQKKELRTQILEYDVDKKIAFYDTGAIIKQDSTQLKSLEGLYDINNDMIYFKHFVSIEDSSFNMKTDSLQYDTKIKKAYFLGPTLILPDSSSIYCEAGYYDIDKGNAEFRENVKYIEGDTKASAIVIRYYDDIEKLVLAGEAWYIDTDQEVHADSIHHFRKIEKSIMMGNVRVDGESSKVNGSYIVFDHDSGDFSSAGRSTVSEENIIISSDLLDFKEEGEGFASGNVVMVDTSSQTSIYGEYLVTRDNQKNFIVYSDSTRRPLMKKVMDADTLFLSADTLFSYEKIIENDTFQIVNAFYDVKIFHDTYQGIADSLSYNSRDSVFHLFSSPILWSDTTQFAGDSISIYLNDDKIDRLHLRPKATIINKEVERLFNQIGGKDIKAFFKGDSLYLMQSSGNAESIYYMKDESGAYMGAVKTVSSRMNFHFKNDDLEEIKYLEDPVSKMTPIRKELNLPQRLGSFKWEPEKRPPNKESLSIVRKIPIVRKEVIPPTQDTIEIDLEIDPEIEQENEIQDEED